MGEGELGQKVLKEEAGGAESNAANAADAILCPSPTPRLSSPLTPWLAHMEASQPCCLCALSPRAGRFPSLGLRKGQPRGAASHGRHGGGESAERGAWSRATAQCPPATAWGSAWPMGPVLRGPALAGEGGGGSGGQTA